MSTAKQHAQPGLDRLDPERIAADLPAGEDRDFFLAEYRREAAEAVNPARWKELQKFLRLWRHHAEALADPEYVRARDAALAGTSTGGMLLEDYIRDRRGE